MDGGVGMMLRWASTAHRFVPTSTSTILMTWGASVVLYYVLLHVDVSGRRRLSDNVSQQRQKRRRGWVGTLFVAELLTTAAAAGGSHDGMHLASFREAVHDPLNHLASWRRSSGGDGVEAARSVRGNQSPPPPPPPPDDSSYYCRWRGIRCDADNRVAAIDLSAMNLTGPLSPSLGLLSHLIVLNLADNRFYGAIPQQLGLLCSSTSCGASSSSLMVLDLRKNDLSGSLPSSLGNLTQLHVLDVSSNGLSGCIPRELANLAQLRELLLSDNRFGCAIPPEFGNLTSLQKLTLYSNRISGPLPPSLGNLERLLVLRAGGNSLSGSIPPELSRCVLLQVLGLAENSLQGSIPAMFGEKLLDLNILTLRLNNLAGGIPSQLGNLSKLNMLSLSDNKLSGFIPQQLGKLVSITQLYLYRNALSGTIPEAIGNCTSLTQLDLSENLLQGVISDALVTPLSRLEVLYLHQNNLSGPIPLGLIKLSSLRKVDLSINELTGTIPIGLQHLRNLTSLLVSENQLVGIIPPLMGSYTEILTVLDVSLNRLTGSIPPEVCKYGQLLYFIASDNQLTGEIPQGVSQCQSLLVLYLNGNRLSGKIPFQLGTQLVSLTQVLDLSNNLLTGSLPRHLGELGQLAVLNLSFNSLSGNIHPDLAKCSELVQLDLSHNQLTGSIPQELGSLAKLETLILSGNELTGAIPNSLGKLRLLKELQLGGNKLSGEIPTDLSGDVSLEIALNLSHNRLTGEIPAELANLTKLENVHLEGNQLGGCIPETFAHVSSLVVFNVSHNRLVGRIPEALFFQKMAASNFVGNVGLCGAPLTKVCGDGGRGRSDDCDNYCRVDACGNSMEQHRSINNYAAAFCALAGLLVLVLAATRGYYYYYSKCSKVGDTGDLDLDLAQQQLPWPEEVKLEGAVLSTASSAAHHFINHFSPRLQMHLSYRDILAATHNFSDRFLLGSGACGTVYKATFSRPQLPPIVLAIKKLSKGGSRSSSLGNSFHAEIVTLGKIQHRNIVKLYGYYSHRQDGDLLFYEYLPKGSLGDLLHGAGGCALDWKTRYRIALGAAEGLSYLHHDCKPGIVHRDVKSTNILLDDEYGAHVGDFGLAKIIDVDSGCAASQSMSGVAGSYGYIAPEYAYTMKVTEKCDVYSFGVVLLELLTRRRPVQPLEKGGDLVTWVRQSMKMEGGKEMTAGVLDAGLVASWESSSTWNSKEEAEMALVLKIALFCTSYSPLDRPSMREVVCMLREVGERSAAAAV